MSSSSRRGRVAGLLYAVLSGEIAFLLWLLLFGARRHLFRKELIA